MAMVQVRCMRVAVDHGFMAMWVAVRRVPRFDPVDVGMLMVRIVGVLVVMFQRLVGMFVDVLLREVQPQSSRHQR